MQQINYTNALGLDIGSKRIGVARINSIARISEPLVTLSNDDSFISELKKIIDKEVIDLIVVGLPRNMSGEETRQTTVVKDFVDNTVRPSINLPIIYYDETLSSVDAEKYSNDTKKKRGIDAIAAAEILRYFNDGNN
jgi:putative Holliday junction resolvase